MVSAKFVFRANPSDKFVFWQQARGGLNGARPSRRLNTLGDEVEDENQAYGHSEQGRATVRRLTAVKRALSTQRESDEIDILATTALAVWSQDRALGLSWSRTSAQAGRERA